MTDNKEPIWITIPEDSSATPTGGQAPTDAAMPSSKKGAMEKVENKFFWGIGFVALLVFASILLAPQQFAGVLKAQLFDGGFQFVPDYEDQEETFPEESEESEVVEEEEAVPDEEAPVEELPEPESDAVVEAEADAVTIQIEPITEAEEFTVEPTDGGEGEGEGEAAAEEVADASSTELDFEGLDVSPDMQALLLGLSAQLEELKEDGRQKDQDILDLTTLLQDQATGLYGAAPLIGTTAPIVGTTTDGITYPTPVPISSATSQVLTPGGGVYRYNTHTVTISPYDVLAQNQAATAGLQAQIGASVQGAVLPYSNQTYNPVLSGVQAQPGTGPREAMLVALLLTAIAVLGFGILRALKA